MIIGENKKALKKPKKNILPPFDDEGWFPNDLVDKDSIEFYGYSISFYSPVSYQGINYYLPSSYAGKTVSLSVEYAECDKPVIEIIYVHNGATIYKNARLSKSGEIKLENIAIPSGATSIRIKAYSEVSGHVYFHNIQLEEGSISTGFKEKLEVNKTSKKGIRFTGLNYVSAHSSTRSPFLDNERDFTMEVDFIPFGASSTANKVEEIVMGWRGYHQGILYNETSGCSRIQINFVRKSDGAIVRQVIETPVLPVGKMSTITVVYRYSNREISVYVDKVLVSKNISIYADKSLYDWWSSSKAYSELLFGSMGTAYGVNGVVERGRLWGVALTEDEIINDTNMLDLFLDYDFRSQNVESNVVKDSSSNNRNGTIGNGAKYVQKISKMIPKKNMLQLEEKYWEQGTVDPLTGNKLSTSNRIRLKSPVKIGGGVTLTMSAPTGYMMVVQCHKSTGGLLDSTWHTTHTLTTPLGTEFIHVLLKKIDDSAILPSEVSSIKAQVEIGSTKTDFETYTPVNKKIKSKLKRSSYKSYPFKFIREGNALFDGSIVGRNQPRITNDGGAVIEEKTENLIVSDLINNNPYYNATNFKVEFLGDYTYKITSLVDAPPAGYHGQFRTDKIVLANKAVTLSAEVLEVSAPYIAMGCGGFGYLTPNTTEEYPMGRYSRTIQHTTDWNHNVGGFYVTANNQNLIKAGDYIVMRCPQIEYKSYSTSFTNGRREIESLRIPNPLSLIDTERGSVEVELTALSGGGQSFHSHDGKYGLHDIVWYASGHGFIVRRNFSISDKVELVICDLSGGLRYGNVDFAWRDGDIIKYRVEWDKKLNQTRLLINGVKMYEHSSMFNIPSSTIIFNIGSRENEGDTNHGRGNAIYKNFTIRNRYGETVYKF